MATASEVSLVIPGRNCGPLLRDCLGAVTPLLESGLREVIFVDDGSTDDTRRTAETFPVTVISGSGRGAGAARNLGTAAATGSLVWFVDADCVAHPDALAKLLPHMRDARVGGVSGTYANLNPHSLLATLIHEEIAQRHSAMPREVDFLATFNVLYRREALERVGGFDERFLKGQDAELSFRVAKAGYGLHFEPASIVAHDHETSWRKYLRVQRQQGYWRVLLHMTHRGRGGGDSYSKLSDHLQPPVAMLTLATLPVAFVPYGWIAPVSCAAALLLLQIPMTLRIMRRTRRGSMLAFAGMSALRAFWRGVGLSAGTVAWIFGRGGMDAAPHGRVVDAD